MSGERCQRLRLEVGPRGQVTRSESRDVVHVDRAQDADDGLPLHASEVLDCVSEKFPVPVALEGKLYGFACLQRARKGCQKCREATPEFEV